jgi:phosphatidylglycerol:prolipoprotein diacylglycerol transferase
MTAAIDVHPALADSVSNFSSQHPGVADPYEYYQLLAEANRESDAVNQALEPFLEPRHPSQLYEGFLEGGLLFGILWVVRVRFPNAPHGMLTGLFFGLYATFRIFAEQFREPDAAWVIDGILTQGQFLSIFMYFFAVAFLIYAFKSRKRPGMEST